MRTLALLLAALLAVPATAQTLDKIRKAGVINLGYIDTAPPFSSADANGEPQGYSVDLCRAVAQSIARQLKQPELKTQWVKLTIQNRLEAVRTKRVDIECGTTTWTLARQKLVDFSLVTFVDGGSILTKLGGRMARMSDFEGKKIAVIKGTTTERALREVLKRTLTTSQIVLVAARDEGLALLRKDDVHGFASDRTSLIGIVTSSGSGDAFRLLDEDFSIEQYALVLPRGDTDFRIAVNRGLAHLYRTGEVQPIYERWLGNLGPPSILLSATYLIQSLSE